MSLRLPDAEYDALRKHVLTRDSWKCRHCGMRNGLEVHHIIYRSNQGPDETWNLITLCGSCHSGMHSHKLILVNNGNNVYPYDADYALFWERLDGWRPS
jgi:5-methylcytosine-specific restriction endonuclease McrA